MVLFIIVFVFHNWQTGPRMLKNMSEHNITGGDPIVISITTLYNSGTLGGP